MRPAPAALHLLALLGRASGSRILAGNNSEDAAAHGDGDGPRGPYIMEGAEGVLESTEEQEALAVAMCTWHPGIYVVKPSSTSTDLSAKDVGKPTSNDASKDVAAKVATDGKGGSALLGLDEARFVDYECEDDEWSQFETLYGLEGFEGGRNRMNFGFKSVCQKNNVVWFYPTDDPNGAFDINRNVCHRLMLWSRTACSVQVRRIARVEEAVAYLGGLPPDSVRHVVLGGHGTGTALAWGPGSQLVGVEELEWARPFGRFYSIPRGRVVRVEKTLQTFAWRMVFPGDTGYVEKVDSDGDARVYFDGLAGVQWVRGSDFAHCQVVAAPMSDLLGGLRRVLQRHGSIFMDSCLSATDEASPNLAEYVAENVGKGVRVIGSRLSFGAVHMARASAWHASIDVASEKQVQRVYVNAEARCPLSARGKRPGSDGNCQCPRGSKCRTKAGKPCPAAGGLFSDVNFLPFCVEDWANDQCECSLAARSPETRSPETTSPEPRSPEAKGLAARSAQLGLLGLALLAATWQC